MKIIEIGVCVDNIDPKGVGRIRFSRYSEITSDKELSVNYTKWDDNDPYVALPFLPVNINFIPELGQTVKIIVYNTNQKQLNQEYIAGPFEFV